MKRFGAAGDLCELLGDLHNFSRTSGQFKVTWWMSFTPAMMKTTTIQSIHVPSYFFFLFKKPFLWDRWKYE